MRNSHYTSQLFNFVNRSSVMRYLTAVWALDPNKYLGLNKYFSWCRTHTPPSALLVSVQMQAILVVAKSYQLMAVWWVSIWFLMEKCLNHKSHHLYWHPFWEHHQRTSIQSLFNSNTYICNSSNSMIFFFFCTVHKNLTRDWTVFHQKLTLFFLFCFWRWCFLGRGVGGGLF